MIAGLCTLEDASTALVFLFVMKIKEKAGEFMCHFSLGSVKDMSRVGCCTA